MNGIKNKLANRLQQIALRVREIFYILFLLCGNTFLFNSCGKTPNIEKETWLLPCNYEGFATVYFNSDKGKDNDSLVRVYKIGQNGVGYTRFDKNDGFSLNLNETMIINMMCDTGITIIPYFENSIMDTVSSNLFATNLIVGRKNNLSFKSILIVRRSK